MSKRPPAPSGEASPILLVEDDLDQAHLVRFLLEDTGEWSVTLAQDGIRGSRLAGEGAWALVITDLNLPGAFGLEVIGACRAADPPVPVIATTGFEGPGYADEAEARGAAAVLHKPLERDELLRAVRAHAIRPTPADEPESAEADPTREAAAQVKLRVLAIGIRPGEVEAGCGATLLRHAARGDRVGVLVLTGGTGKEGDRARAAGRRMGASFFIGSVDPGDGEGFEREIAALIDGALGDLRPDVLYLPTQHRRDPLGPRVRERAIGAASDVPRIFCYESGDPTAEFRPDLFVDASVALAEKLKLLHVLDSPAGSGVHPDEVELAARFWGRYGKSDAAEAFEAERGVSPWREGEPPSDDGS